MGSFERFTTKAHFNSLKRLVLVVGLAVLAVKLVIAGIWPGTAGSPLGLLARVAASLADLGASLRLTLGLPDRGPEGRILVVSTRHGPIGFLVDEVIRVMRFDPAFCREEPNRFGAGYVTSSFTGLGGTWLVIDWDAIRLPSALTTR